MSTVLPISSIVSISHINKQSEISVKRLQGEQIRPYLKELASLLTIYMEWPYLYDGTKEEREEYVLERYVKNPDSVVCIAFDGKKAIGVAMGTSFDKAPEYYKTSFLNGKWNLEKIFYLGELILLPEYRGKKIAKKMYTDLFNFVKERSFNTILLCAVDRSSNFHLNHLKPEDYVSKDGLWEKLGFQKREDLTFNCRWRLVGEEKESDHLLIYWSKPNN